jgi:hypothetical protein
LHYVLSYGAIALVAVGYLTRQNAAYMAYLLPVFFVCVFPHGKWQPEHPILQALPLFPSGGHVVADLVALITVAAVVVKMFRPCAFLAWALVLTHFLPCKCGFVVPPSATLLSATLHALHYVALIDVPVIILYILASPRASFLSRTSFPQMWRLVKVPPPPPYFSPSTFCGQLFQ